MNPQQKPFQTHFVFSFLFTLLLFSSSAFTTHAQEISDLKLNVPIERQLKGGETHAYIIALEANQFLHLVVDQRGIDVVVTLYAPDGKKVIEVDSPNGIQGPEPFSVITQQVGNYRLEVRSLEQISAQGRYEARIEALKNATEKDRNYLAAQTLFLEAVQLQNQGTKETASKAIEKFQSAIPLWRAVEDRLYEGGSVFRIGNIYYSLGDTPKALEAYQEAYKILHAAGSFSEAASALGAIGTSYATLGDRTKAIEYYLKALPILQSVGNRREEALILSNLSGVYSEIGEMQKSLDYTRQALPLRRETGDREGEAYTVGNLGNTYLLIGEPQLALDSLKESGAIFRSINNLQGEATAITRIGRVYANLGNFPKALTVYNEALALWRKVGNRQWEAITLRFIGNSNYSLGDKQKALEFYNQALVIFRETGAKNTEGATLIDIGKVLSETGEQQKALEFYKQALTISRDVNDRSNEATTTKAIAFLYHKSGRKADAIELLNDSLAIYRAIGETRGEADTLYAIALVERASGNLIQARANIENGLTIVESLRTKIIATNLRAYFLANVRNYYELYVDILMELQKDSNSENLKALSLEISERAHARSFLDLLIESRADIRQGVDAKLLEREKSLQLLLTGKAARQTQILSGKHTDEQVTAIAKEISDLTDQFEQIEAEIRRTSPRYAALTQPQSVSAKTIQTELLDKDTALLEYSLGKERSYMWFVTPSEIKSFELPDEEKIEAQARRVFQLLTARNEQTANETAEQRYLRVTKADLDYESEAAKLSEMILAPVAGEIKTKRLLIVADGSLQYVPFAALPSPKSQIQSSKNGSRFLGETNEIVNLPSASVLAELRRDTAARPSAPLSVAVFADPVFSFDDIRLNLSAFKKNRLVSNKSNELIASRDVDSKQENNSVTSGRNKTNQTARKTIVPATVPDPDVLRAFNETSAPRDGLRIPRLPFSRREATNILALTSDKQELSALDFKANLQTATSPELAKYRIVHFATHGLLDNVHPGLSGIVLSLVDETGDARDGFLRLNEIYNLKLPADLIVLSACQTALGKNVKGEGLIGLTRGFMYAGAPRVVASLWKVDDAATAELMRIFYYKMLKENARPSAALRAAKLEMSQNARWKSPYYWAAFTLQGEWK